MHANPTPAQTKPGENGILDTAKETIATEIAGLKKLQDSLGIAFEEAVCLLLSAKGRVVVGGIGKSGHVARKVAATLASTGTLAQYVHPTEASHGDLGMLCERDVLILMSWSGGTKELADMITYSRRFNIPLIAITSKEDSELGKNADIVLKLPQHEEACPFNMAPTTSTTMMMALGDALAMALLAGRGFSRDDYGIRHPGGKLGAMFTRVGDIMHAEELPILNENTLMKDALKTMIDVNIGALISVDADGKLSGILTDGDLKRRMTSDFLDKKLKDIATPQPLTISSSALAVKAMQIMSSRQNPISELIVTSEDGRPIGLLQMYQCLKAGL